MSHLKMQRRWVSLNPTKMRRLFGGVWKRYATHARAQNARTLQKVKDPAWGAFQQNLNRTYPSKFCVVPIPVCHLVKYIQTSILIEERTGWYHFIFSYRTYVNWDCALMQTESNGQRRETPLCKCQKPSDYTQKSTTHFVVRWICHQYMATTRNEPNDNIASVDNDVGNDVH